MSNAQREDFAARVSRRLLKKAEELEDELRAGRRTYGDQEEGIADLRRIAGLFEPNGPHRKVARTQEETEPLAVFHAALDRLGAPTNPDGPHQLPPHRTVQ